MSQAIFRSKSWKENWKEGIFWSNKHKILLGVAVKQGEENSKKSALQSEDLHYNNIFLLNEWVDSRHTISM